MSAFKKSSIVLLCLSLAIACLVGVFTIIDASSVRANQNEVPHPVSTIQSTVIISPTGLLATLYPDQQLTLTFWITNAGVSPITYTIYEMSATPGLAGYTLQPVSSPVIDPNARSQIDTQGAALVIIHLREQPDLSPAYNITDRASRGQYVYDRLLETASHSVELYRWLESQGTYPHRLLTANAIAATLNSSQLNILAANPAVRQITPNRQFQIIPAVTTPLVGPQLPTITSVKTDTVEWNISKIRADQAWSTLDITGTGAVVAIMDTGVMYNHPALINSYRGNLGSGGFNHNYNWFDFVENGQNVPYDPVDHGTMGAGIVSGDDGAGNQIGVAPGAKWIAVRACDYSCSDADLLAAFDWLLAPTDLSDANPRPDKRPDIVLGMWGGGGCNTFFQSNLNALRAAGILPVFPPGGSGPSCSSVGSPAALDQALAAGATDETDNIAPFSARGPGCGSIIKPDLSAPGVNVRTSTADPGYGITSGTSWSAAHAAGAAALVFSANPSLGPDAVEDILFSTALCLNAPPPSCEGDNLCPGANNAYGHGRIDAFEAVSTTLGALAPDILPWLSETPISGTLDVSETVAITVTFDASGLGVGVYTGTLVVESNDRQTPSITLPVSLTVYTPCEPIEDLTGNFTPSNPEAGDVVTFTASATGTLPITYTWDFDDSSDATGAVVTHSFTAQGSYTVTLTATNYCDSQTLDLFVPVAVVCDPLSDLMGSFTPPNPVAGDLVTFTANASGTLPITYTWDFDDGFSDTGEVVTHAFTNTGTYTVTLTAKNLCDSQTKKLIVPVAAVCDPPAILIEGFTPLNPTVGDVVTFTASATGTLPISYTWRFENGSTVIGQEATYVFASPGMHVVDLIVENTCDQVEIEIDVPVEAIIHRYHLPMISR